jgi:3-oxoacyl-[acyl-carrier-protein] synthase III
MSGSALHPRWLSAGLYVPEKKLTNADVAKFVDTTDQWILQRTGIRQRFIAHEDECSTTMAIEAGKEAIKNAGIHSHQIDLLIVATSTPSKHMPSCASWVQKALDIKPCPAFDLNAACSGFMYALAEVELWIKSGKAKCALIIGSDVSSRILNWEDRSTCVLFGDGAGACIFAADQRKGLVSVDLGADGQFAELLQTEGKILQQGSSCIEMKGREIYKKAVQTLAYLVNKLVSENEIELEQIDWMVPHQANIRIIESTAKSLNIPMSKVILTIDQYANTVAASIPMALAYGRESGKIKDQDLLVLEAFGAGLTWGGALLYA